MARIINGKTGNILFSNRIPRQLLSDFSFSHNQNPI